MCVVVSYRLGTSVPTLILESLLVQGGVIPMPGEEVTRVVNAEGLVNVGGDKVIETRLGARSHGSRRQSRLRLQTLHGLDVRLLLGLGKRAPESAKAQSATRV